MNRLTRNTSWVVLALFVALQACKKDDDDESPVVEYDDTPYELKVGNLPQPDIADDNELTLEGVQLGRMLFYEKALSLDGTQACASCHLQEYGFSDTAQFSIGVEGLKGARHAMSVFNMAWNTNGFFWDGRALLLRHQSLMPIEDPLEMNETLSSVVAKLSGMQKYRDQFTRAFNSDRIDSKKISLALEQFMNSIVSVNSKYDRFVAGTETLTESEERGRELFFTEYNPGFPALSGADCAHCHGGNNFENDRYMNNGLDTDANQTDHGRELVTGHQMDRGKFKVPSLRNIEVTGPYMHDGRFATLEEVIDHYDHGLEPSATIDPALEYTRATGLQLTAQDKADLLAFLKTLTDDDLLTNPEYSDPFN